MGEFNSDDHYIYYCGQKSHKWSSHHSQQESKMRYLNAISKTTEWSVSFQGKTFSITVIQVYVLISNTEEAELEWFYEDLQDLLELTPKKDILYIIGDWNESRKSRNTWSNRQIWSWSKKWSREKVNRVLPREQTGHSKHPLQQHKRWLYTWTPPDGQYLNQIDYILCSQRWRSST